MVTDAIGQMRAAAKGDEINEGDTIATGALSSVQLRMVDGAFVALRAESKIKFDEYRYSGKEGDEEHGLISLLAGSTRTVTGVIGRSDKAKYAINTPTATIGMRNADQETVYVSAPGEHSGTTKPVASTWPSPSMALGHVESAADSRGAVRLAQASATRTDVDMPPVLAQEPPGGTLPFTLPGVPPGTYSKVNIGQSSMTTQAGTTPIYTNQVGYAPSTNAPALILLQIPDFFKVTGNPGDRRQQQIQQGQQTASSGDSTSASSIRTVAGVDSFVRSPKGGTSGGIATRGTTISMVTGAAASTNNSMTPVVQKITLTDTGGTGITLDETRQALNIPSSVPVFITQGAAGMLPVSGGFDYTFVGAAKPTDNFGNAGTLNSASLTADFTNSKVSAAVNLTITGNTWAATTGTGSYKSATSYVPIQQIPQGSFFQAQTGQSGSNLTTTVNGGAADVQGKMIGAFTGDAQGLAMIYSMNKGGITGTTVSGVAAFQNQSSPGNVGTLTTATVTSPSAGARNSTLSVTFNSQSVNTSLIVTAPSGAGLNFSTPLNAATPTGNSGALTGGIVTARPLIISPLNGAGLSYTTFSGPTFKR